MALGLRNQATLTSSPNHMQQSISGGRANRSALIVVTVRSLRDPLGFRSYGSVVITRSETLLDNQEMWQAGGPGALTSSSHSR
jgi:hypothetical protein